MENLLAIVIKVTDLDFANIAVILDKSLEVMGSLHRTTGSTRFQKKQIVMTHKVYFKSPRQVVSRLHS